MKAMNIFKYIIICLFVFGFINPADAVVKISPERFELKAQKDKKYLTSFFTVKITGSEPVRYKVYTDYFEVSEKGTLLTGLEGDFQNSIVDKIRFNPKEVTVYPDKPRKIRFTLLSLDKLPDGESRGVIFLEDTKTRIQTLRDSNNNIAASINLKTRIAIPIYVDKGNIKKEAKIEELSVIKEEDKLLYKLLVNSKGNSKVRVKGKGLITRGKELVAEFPIDSRPVQAGIVGEFINTVPTENLVKGEDYLLKVNLKYDDAKSKTKYITEKIEFAY